MSTVTLTVDSREFHIHPTPPLSRTYHIIQLKECYDHYIHYMYRDIWQQKGAAELQIKQGDKGMGPTGQR